MWGVTRGWAQFLDEPTSGMDPAAKRFTWDVITRHKRHRAVVLTTHSMEEADALSDQIVILQQGRRAAQGSPFDLKERYGVGYTLTVVCHDGGNHRLSGDSRGSGGWPRPGKGGPGAVCEGVDTRRPLSVEDDVRLRHSESLDAAVCVWEPGPEDLVLTHAARVISACRPLCHTTEAQHTASRSAASNAAAMCASLSGDGAAPRCAPDGRISVPQPSSGSAAQAIRAAQVSVDCDGRTGGRGGCGVQRGQHQGIATWHERRSGDTHDIPAACEAEVQCAVGGRARRGARRGGAVAESTGAGSSRPHSAADDLEELADMASLIERSGSSGMGGRPPRYPGQAAAQGQDREQPARGVGAWGPGDGSTGRGPDVPRLHLQRVLPGGSARSRTPDSSSSRKQRSSQRSDSSLPLRSMSSGDGWDGGAPPAAMPARGSRTLRSDMMSFGMHTHSSMELDGIIAAAESAGLLQPAQPPGAQRVRMSPRGRGRRMPPAPAGVSPRAPSPRLPTHPEESPSEPPLLDSAHARQSSWLVTGSLGGVFGSGGLSPTSDGHTPTTAAGELFPDEDIFMQSETYRCASQFCCDAPRPTGLA